MAYTRHTGDSEWYIFATGSNPEAVEDEQLAIYHTSAMEPQEHPNHLIWRYRELKEMLRTNDLSAIPGSHRQRDTLVRCIRQFLEDTERDWAERKAARSRL